jgi:large subunit ribosomal protein L10
MNAQDVKKATVKEFTKLILEYPIIGTINMESLPTPQLQTMRSQLRETVLMKMTKRRLIDLAFDEAEKKKPGVAKLKDYMRGMPALLFTKENPFILFKTLQKNKSNAPAKGGQTAPIDIIVKAGSTSFAPGPIISELGGIGIKTGIENGKVAIKEDSLVVKEGEVISANVAGILTRLGIEPMEVGLDVTAVFEDGIVFDKKTLHVDEKEYIDNITMCAKHSFNLAMEAGILTKETTELMVTKAFNEAKSLALSCDILSKDVIAELLSKAQCQMQSVGSKYLNQV